MSRMEVLIAPTPSLGDKLEEISDILNLQKQGSHISNQEPEFDDNGNPIKRRHRSGRHHRHRRPKLTPEERLALCKFTECRVLLDVEPDENHANRKSGSKKVRSIDQTERDNEENNVNLDENEQKLNILIGSVKSRSPILDQPKTENKEFDRNESEAMRTIENEEIIKANENDDLEDAIQEEQNTPKTESESAVSIIDQNYEENLKNEENEILERELLSEQNHVTESESETFDENAEENLKNEENELFEKELLSEMNHITESESETFNQSEEENLKNEENELLEKSLISEQNHVTESESETFNESEEENLKNEENLLLEKGLLSEQNHKTESESEAMNQSDEESLKAHENEDLEDAIEEEANYHSETIQNVPEEVKNTPILGVDEDQDETNEQIKTKTDSASEVFKEEPAEELPEEVIKEREMPLSPRSKKMQNVKFTGLVTILDVQPDPAKVEAYNQKRKHRHRRTRVKRIRTIDNTNAENELIGNVGAIANVHLKSVSTRPVESDTEEHVKSEENKYLQNAIDEENDRIQNEEDLKLSESEALRRAISEEKVIVAESGMTTETEELTLYSEEEKLKSSEDENLQNAIFEESLRRDTESETDLTDANDLEMIKMDESEVIRRELNEEKNYESESDFSMAFSENENMKNDESDVLRREILEEKNYESESDFSMAFSENENMKNDESEVLRTEIAEELEFASESDFSMDADEYETFKNDESDILRKEILEEKNYESEYDLSMADSENENMKADEGEILTREIEEEGMFEYNERCFDIENLKFAEDCELKRAIKEENAAFDLSDEEELKFGEDDELEKALQEEKEADELQEAILSEAPPMDSESNVMSEAKEKSEPEPYEKVFHASIDVGIQASLVDIDALLRQSRRSWRGGEEKKLGLLDDISDSEGTDVEVKETIKNDESEALKDLIEEEGREIESESKISESMAESENERMKDAEDAELLNEIDEENNYESEISESMAESENERMKDAEDEELLNEIDEENNYESESEASMADSENEAMMEAENEVLMKEIDEEQNYQSEVSESETKDEDIEDYKDAESDALSKQIVEEENHISENAFDTNELASQSETFNDEVSEEIKHQQEPEIVEEEEQVEQKEPEPEPDPEPEPEPEPEPAEEIHSVHEPEPIVKITEPAPRDRAIAPSEPQTPQSPRHRRRVRRSTPKAEADIQCTLLSFPPICEVRNPNSTCPTPKIPALHPFSPRAPRPSPMQYNEYESPNASAYGSPRSPPKEPELEELTLLSESSSEAGVDKQNNQNEEDFSTPKKEFFRVMAPDSDSDSFNLSPRGNHSTIPRGRSSSRAMPVRMPISRRAPNNTLTNPVDAAPPSPSMDRLKKRAYKLEPMINTNSDQLEHLLYVLNQEKKIFVRERRFKDSLKCNAAIQHVSNALSKAQQRELNEADTSVNSNSSLSNANANTNSTIVARRLEAFDADTRIKEEELVDKQRAARRQLRSEQKAEINALGKNWNSPRMKRKYNRPSEKLLELKKKYDEIVAQNGDSEEIKDELDKLKKIEASEAFNRMQHDYDLALQALLEKHQQDTALFYESNRVKLERFKQQRAKDRRALEFRHIELDRPSLNKRENGILDSMIQSEVHESDSNYGIESLGAESGADAGLTDECGESEKLELPPLDNRRPKGPRSPKADSS